MKKIFTFIVTLVIVACLGIGGFFFYKRTTPEYALYQAAKAVETSGINGLEDYVTADAWETIEMVTDIADNPFVAGLLGMFSGTEELQTLKNNISEIKWSVKDVLKGKTESKVKLGFDYHGEITGTIELNMVKVDGNWKISGIGMPSIDKLPSGSEETQA